VENDVTKALLNVFEHCSREVLGAFLKLLNVKDHPETFEFDFQITDTFSYRQKPKRIMLALISASTSRISNSSYIVERSRPDACVFNKDTAVLIEAKTQSPLVKEQIESHIKQYLGSTTQKRTITWEEIGENSKTVRKSLPPGDQFIVSQFCAFLNWLA